MSPVGFTLRRNFPTVHYLSILAPLRNGITRWQPLYFARTDPSAKIISNERIIGIATCCNGSFLPSHVIAAIPSTSSTTNQKQYDFNEMKITLKHVLTIKIRHFWQHHPGRGHSEPVVQLEGAG